MTIETILLDMDGVIANFNASALRANGCSSLTPIKQWHIEQVIGVSVNQFWRRIDACADFWETLEPYEGMRDFVKDLQRIAPVVIATSPPKNPRALADKLRWLYKHLDWKVGDVMMGRQKWLMAKPGNVLVDDSYDNVRRFREAGGEAVLFPRPWNQDPMLGMPDSFCERHRQESVLDSLYQICDNSGEEA